MVSKTIVFCLIVVAFLSGAIMTLAVGRLAGFSRPVAKTTNQNGLAVAESYGQQRVDQLATVAPKSFVPILMYHYIRDYTNPQDQLGIALSVSPKKFDEQLTTLENAGYHTISLTDFISGNYDGKAIVLTFDDGYSDHFTDALPILRNHGYTGTFFIVGGFVGKGSYMDKAQIAELAESGMELGGHTMTHKNLATASLVTAKQEISQSLRGVSPIFAYPSGKYSNETLSILSTFNVKAAVTTDLGIATDISNPLLLPRIRVKEQTDLLKVIADEEFRARHPLTPTQSSTSQTPAN